MTMGAFPCQLRGSDDANAASEGRVVDVSFVPKYEPGPMVTGVGAFSPNPVKRADLVGIAIAGNPQTLSRNHFNLKICR